MMWAIRSTWAPSPSLLCNFLGAPACPAVTFQLWLTFCCGAASLTYVSELQGISFSDCLFTNCLTTWTGCSLPAVLVLRAGLTRTEGIWGEGGASVLRSPTPRSSLKHPQKRRMRVTERACVTSFVTDKCYRIRSTMQPRGHYSWHQSRDQQTAACPALRCSSQPEQGDGLEFTQLLRSGQQHHGQRWAEKSGCASALQKQAQVCSRRAVGKWRCNCHS